MREVYILGFVEEYTSPYNGALEPVFMYLSPHVSRNKAFVTAKQMVDATGADGLRMYEHEYGDRMVPGHFYLYRTKFGAVCRDVGGGSIEEDKSIFIHEYVVGMVRERSTHEQSEGVTVKEPSANPAQAGAVD